jgi:serine protease Do
LNADLAKQFGVSKTQGAIVTEVRTGTPAAKAGLQPGDVVVEFDGHAVDSPRDLQGVVERSKIGTSHKLVVNRHGKQETLTVGLEATPQSAVADSNDPSASKSEFSALGLEVSELTGDVASRLGLKEGEGVVVSSVVPQGPADNAGIKEGMVISRVGQTPVTNIESFRAAVTKSNLKDGLLLLVRTAESARFLVLKVA